VDICQVIGGNSHRLPIGWSTAIGLGAVGGPSPRERASVSGRRVACARSTYSRTGASNSCAAVGEVGCAGAGRNTWAARFQAGAFHYPLIIRPSGRHPAAWRRARVTEGANDPRPYRKLTPVVLTTRSSICSIHLRFIIVMIARIAVSFITKSMQTSAKDNVSVHCHFIYCPRTCPP
jgi:hypothetical protein